MVKQKAHLPGLLLVSLPSCCGVRLHQYPECTPPPNAQNIAPLRVRNMYTSNKHALRVQWSSSTMLHVEVIHEILTACGDNACHALLRVCKPVHHTYSSSRRPNSA